MKAIVNGASGYIGYYLVKELLENGHTVLAVCRKMSEQLGVFVNHDNFRAVVCSQSELAEKLGVENADVWYQLVWEGANGILRSNPEIQLNNELISVAAMKTAAETGCKKIIYAGTVYENTAPVILENPVFNTNSFYVISKKHTHEITRQLSKKYDIDYVWCQFCHPVGVYMAENQMLPSAVKAFVNNEEILFGSCEQIYDIFSVKNLACAFRLLAEHTNSKDFYYIGSGKPQVLKKYIQKAADICGYKREIAFGKRKDDGMRYCEEWFDSSDFISEFGSYEKESYENAVLEIAGYMKK